MPAGHIVISQTTYCENQELCTGSVIPYTTTTIRPSVTCTVHMLQASHALPVICAWQVIALWALDSLEAVRAVQDT